MIGEIIQFERDSKKIKAIVFCYMPNGGPEMDQGYLKAYLWKDQKANHNNIHLVKLAEPTLEVLTLDRSIGAKMEEDYVNSAKDPERCH